MKANFNLAGRIAAALAVTSLAAAPAMAADVIYQEPPAPAAVIEDLPGVAGWAGPYAGVAAGYSFKSRSDTDSGRVKTDGFSGGGFAGWQGQSGSFVYGAEADVNYSGVDGDNGDTASRTRVDGSIRGRAGVAVNDRILVYGTAGGAANKTRIRDSQGSDSNTMLGYTVGAGIDANLTDRVFARGEYRYSDYGSESFDTGSGAQDVDSRENKAIVGLGIQF